ncbi:unnamed protein product [Clonostachys chloroleuca]|uniref:Amidohydrolase-related domain-containing protein n=1 Tax=Clonostachys chloroleuca TaxID=1926264 RepID=A0AA35PXY4_9HYPO|nr:unnamed protein product [Clonostachys chloroleuca]
MAIAFRALRLLCSSSDELINDGVVVVRDRKIDNVGPWRTIQPSLPRDVAVRDLGDVTLMPGLFDCHVHLQMDPSKINTSTAITLTDDELLPLMQTNALRLLDAGVTTARDLGSRGITAVHLRDKIKAGEVPGPRLQCANAPLTVAGGHCHAMGGVCEGVEGVREEVRKRAAEGADLIKVMSTGGFMTAGSHPSQARFTQEEMNAIKDEARKFNLPVTAHAMGIEGIERVANAKFDTVEHCAWINREGRAVFDADVARKLLDNNIAVCPTMNSACIEKHYFCPWDKRAVVVDNWVSLRKANIKIFMGTDSGIGLCRFERYADGLTVMADAGYTNRELIAAATDVAAEVCGLAGETGKLEPGLAADLVAFAGNPLEDLNAFFAPKFVMASGREHKLTPIEPIGDNAEAGALTVKLLRQGAGLQEDIPIQR